MLPAHVYVHVPFCPRRCTYCDFAIAVRRTAPVGEYLEALQRELARRRVGAPPRTLYLGGGTPSRLGGAGVAELARMFHADGGGVEEFTLEANPDDVTAANARAWVAAGVNRLSIGAQSFDAGVLAWMHRSHSPEAIGSAVREARAAGITNVSLDLMFALQTGPQRRWAEDLEAAIALEPDHVSLYGLTVEEHTALAHRLARGQERPVPEGRYAEEYLAAHQRLDRAGYRFYEVSNAARPGHEALHNSVYWRLAPYLGVGPSAHSYDGVARWWNEPVYVRWLAAVRKRGTAVQGREVPGEEARRLERLYLSLRTSEGMLLADAPVSLAPRAARWERAGWARFSHAADGVRVRLTAEGWLRLDELVASV